MFTYESTGLLIPISQVGGIDVFLGAVNEVYKTDFADAQEFDDSMVMGTYESPDNVVSAAIDSEEVDTSDGVVMVELSAAIYGTNEYDEISSVMKMLGYEGWDEAGDLVGNYLVECYQ